MSQTLRIINPNWNTAVTKSMSSALDGMRHDGGPQLDWVSLKGGPFGNESEADSIRVAPLLAEYVKSDNEADAFLIACYVGPGPHLRRDITDRPVFGIAE
jgi:Asp/Glu/hydantoin racemase